MDVTLDVQEDPQRPLFLDGTQLSCGIDVDKALIGVTGDGMALTVVSNPIGFSMTVDEGTSLGTAVPVEVVEPAPDESQPDLEPRPAATTETQSATESRVHLKSDTWRKKKLAESIRLTDVLSPTQRQELINFLGEHHM